MTITAVKDIHKFWRGVTGWSKYTVYSGYEALQPGDRFLA